MSEPIKPQKNSPRAYLHDLNNNNSTDATVRSPVDFYNTRLRKDGDPILTEIEYSVMMRKKFQARKRDGGVTQFIIVDKKDLEDISVTEHKVLLEGIDKLKDNV